jgi:PKD repeat protein
VAPTAVFTYSCTDLACSFNGSASSDPVGSTTSCAWNFGDNTSGTGVTTSRTYASAGTRTVTLTVTDNGGATGSTSQSVTTTAPGTSIARELHRGRDAARAADALRVSLGRFERAVLDMVLAWLKGDWAAAHRASTVQADMAPGSIPHFQVAEEARRLNRPREARDVLGRLDPETGELRGWIFYWVELACAHHMLRDHARELEVASGCRRLHPDSPMAALLEVRAFAALGRECDVVRVVDQLLASPAARPAAGAVMVEAALELLAHAPAAVGSGAARAAQALLERAVEWYRVGDSATGAAGGAHHRRELGRALYHAGRLDDARAIFDELVTKSGGRVPRYETPGRKRGHPEACHSFWQGRRGRPLALTTVLPVPH